MRYAILIEYNGANYKGWQRQNDQNTIQGQIEKVLSQFANHPIEIDAAGRTDTGVHALGQTATFDSTVNRQLYGWKTAANSMLPCDIRIKAIVPVADDFHARFSAIARTYQYYLYNSPIQSAIINETIGYYAHKLDLTKMLSASEYLVGQHDFSAFRTSICQANSPVKNMQTINIEQRGNVIRFEFTANAFLHHMIRNIIGAMVYIGSNRLSVEDFAQRFKSKNRGAMPPTFMPNGLYLSHIQYEDNIFQEYFYEHSKESNWMFYL